MRANPSTEDPSIPTPSSRASLRTASVIPTLFNCPRMSTNQRWIISTPRSSQNFTISFVDFRLSIPSLPPSSLVAPRPRAARLPPKHHRHVPLRFESESLVEGVLVFREQEEIRTVLVGCGKAEQ